MKSQFPFWTQFICRQMTYSNSICHQENPHQNNFLRVTVKSSNFDFVRYRYRKTARHFHSTYSGKFHFDSQLLNCVVAIDFNKIFIRLNVFDYCAYNNANNFIYNLIQSNKLLKRKKNHKPMFYTL